jgi:hypothetical protein
LRRCKGWPLGFFLSAEAPMTAIERAPNKREKIDGGGRGHGAYFLG